MIRLMKTLLVVVSTAAAMLSCGKDDEITKAKPEEEQRYIPPNGRYEIVEYLDRNYCRFDVPVSHEYTNQVYVRNDSLFGIGPVGLYFEGEGHIYRSSVGTCSHDDMCQYYPATCLNLIETVWDLQFSKDGYMFSGHHTETHTVGSRCIPLGTNGERTCFYRYKIYGQLIR